MIHNPCPANIMHLSYSEPDSNTQESISSLAATAETTDETAATTTTAIIMTSMPPINTNIVYASCIPILPILSHYNSLHFGRQPENEFF